MPYSTGGKQRTEAAQVPASIRGINAVASLAAMDPQECIYCFNILAEDFGMQVRDGYQEWANGFTNEGRTVITFEGNDSADDRLWVANEDGIYNVTTEGTTVPTKVATFPINSILAGICTYVTFANAAGDRFVLLTDLANGYWVYTQTTDTWAAVAAGGGATQIANVDPADFDYVMVWKNRVWFIERDGTSAWYLAAGALYGAATQFNFGLQFTEGGGALRAMYNWTLDGGVGIDDYLVAVSSGGDIAIYQGTDPASASTFALVGTWSIGELPAGNRFGTQFGGEVYLLSVYGLLPLSKILNGASTTDPHSYLTRNVSPYVRTVMDEAKDSFGWHVHVHPKQATLFINSPARIGQQQLAFTMYYGTQAWSMVRGLNKNHTANWRGEVYWVDSTRDKIMIQRGAVDNVMLDPVTDGDAEGIEWDVLTAYQHLGQPARYKRCQFIRPMFVAGTQPSFSVAARYDYDVAELVGSPTLGGSTSAVWGSGLWGEDLSAGGLQASDNPRGGAGLGCHVAISIRGRSAESAILIAFDISADFGGLM